MIYIYIGIAYIGLLALILVFFRGCHILNDEGRDDE
jgi:hypothetical protein